MGRMRTVKPEAFLSLNLADVDRGIRWTFAGLWTVCDDEGRAAWEPRLLKAAIYPLDDAVTAAVLEADMRELERVHSVCFYEVNGRQYVHVPSWHEHQHPNRKVDSKLPPCPKSEHVPSTGNSTDMQRSDIAVHKPVQLTPVVVVEGRGEGEGEGEGDVEGAIPARSTHASMRPHPASSPFDEFWSVFPKKVAKVAAQRRFATLVRRGVDPAEIIAGAKAYRESRHGEDPQFTKQPDGWLNAGRWQDEPELPYRPAGNEQGQATVKAEGWLTVGTEPTHQQITGAAG